MCILPNAESRNTMLPKSLNDPVRSAVTPDGRTYFYDASGNTSWTRPSELDGWSYAVVRGHRFYVDEETGDTVTQLPKMNPASATTEDGTACLHPKPPAGMGFVEEAREEGCPAPIDPRTGEPFKCCMALCGEEWCMDDHGSYPYCRLASTTRDPVDMSMFKRNGWMYGWSVRSGFENIVNRAMVDGGGKLWLCDQHMDIVDRIFARQKASMDKAKDVAIRSTVASLSVAALVAASMASNNDQEKVCSD